MDDNKKRLVASIVEFLGDELNGDSLSPDARESLEVAIQCLEAAYGVTPVEATLNSKKLLEIFNDAMKDAQSPTPSQPVSDEVKQEAEREKNEGNNLMKMERFEDALKCYTKAISLDGNNAVYYCNRAAAYSKLNRHEEALSDCKKAIQIDPNYGKAYGRMGLAYASLNDHQKARDCYKKAVELDPNNESYQNNLRIAEEKVAELNQARGGNPFAAGMGGMGGMGGMPGMGFPLDLGSLFSNPALVNMATQLMRDPNMQSLMNNIIGGAGAPPGPAAPGPAPAAPEGPAPEGPPGTGIDLLLQAGQQIAAQMQQANPELVEQLRRQMGANPARNPEDPSSDQGGNQDKDPNQS